MVDAGVDWTGNVEVSEIASCKLWGVGQKTGQSFQEILTAWLQREGGEKLGLNCRRVLGSTSCLALVPGKSACGGSEINLLCIDEPRERMFCWCSVSYTPFSTFLD